MVPWGVRECYLTGDVDAVLHDEPVPGDRQTEPERRGGGTGATDGTGTIGVRSDSAGTLQIVLDLNGFSR